MHRNTLRIRMWICPGDNYSACHTHIPQYLLSTSSEVGPPCYLLKAGNITAQNEDHAALFPLICLM